MQNENGQSVETTTAREDVIQVQQPPSAPNEVGFDPNAPLITEPHDPNAEDKKTSDDAAAGTKESEVTQEQKDEFETLASQADELLEPAVQPPGQQQQQQQQQEYTDSEKIDYLIATVHQMLQGNQPTTQVPQQQETTAPNIYGEFDEGTPQEFTQIPDNHPMMVEFRAMKDELQNLHGAVAGVQSNQYTFQQGLAQQQADQEFSKEVQDLQDEYHLSEVDAKRTLALFKSGRYADGMRFARGRSQVETATAGQREQRSNDRSLAGRPAIPGGNNPGPESNEDLLRQKLSEYQAMPDGPDKDAAAEWLILNGGMDLVRSHAAETARRSVNAQPIPENPS